MNEPVTTPKAKRGRPALEYPKVKINFRLDDDLVRHLRGLGPGYSTKVNAMLRKACGLK